ncbi:hypothetical protein H8356DRAFT_1335366 [Neocallimastix lanati (nom. inval.)]|nr:hypothetical protein H8356DRAFT_1335366 [Neocallimastix sp. JGI-2020a]
MGCSSFGMANTACPLVGGCVGRHIKQCTCNGGTLSNLAPSPHYSIKAKRERREGWDFSIRPVIVVPPSHPHTHIYLPLVGTTRERGGGNAVPAYIVGSTYCRRTVFVRTFSHLLILIYSDDSLRESVRQLRGNARISSSNRHFAFTGNMTAWASTGMSYWLALCYCIVLRSIYWGACPVVPCLRLSLSLSIRVAALTCLWLIALGPGIATIIWLGLARSQPGTRA